MILYVCVRVWVGGCFIQEELAFVFEMLQQFEDALVQYDELDALFTQYVLNFGAGGKQSAFALGSKKIACLGGCFGPSFHFFSTDAANWLGSFCAPVRNWGGLLLRRPIDMEKRDLIQRGEANLLDLRSYLFSRQCTLLIFLQRPWEVTHRALELLHNCVQELRLLEVYSSCTITLWYHRCREFFECIPHFIRQQSSCSSLIVDIHIHTMRTNNYLNPFSQICSCNLRHSMVVRCFW